MSARWVDQRPERRQFIREDPSPRWRDLTRADALKLALLAVLVVIGSVKW